MKVAVVHNRDRSGVINVFGPQNREKYNPKTVERVARALEAGGHTVRILDGNMHLVEQLREFMPRVITGERPGMVFNMAYGIQGVSRYTHLPAMLEMLGVPYVGSGPAAHGLALDKVIAKIVFQNAGLPTPGFWNFQSADDVFDDLRFPAIVKPKMEAVSYGIRVVNDEASLRAAVADIIREFQQHVLVEEFIPGREFAVGLLGNADPEVLPIVEIDLEGDPNAIQTAGDKLAKPRSKLCPAPLEEAKASAIRALVTQAFRSLDLFDFARVDLRMDAAGRLYILEINSMASLGLTGTYVHAAQVAGYTYDQLINRMLEHAAVRYFGQAYLADAQTGEAAAPQRKLSARVRTYLRSQAHTFEDLVRRLVDMRSPLDEAEHVNAFGEWVTGQLRHVGFTVTVYPQDDIGDILYFRNHDEPEDDVLLLGHLDTPPNTTFGFVPYRREGNRMYGTGVAENKGGIAVALAALRALRFTRSLRRVRCGLLLTTDETLDGTRGRPVVEERAAAARHVVGLKASHANGELAVSRSGRLTYRVEADTRRVAAKVDATDVLRHLFIRLARLQGLDAPTEGIRVGIRRVTVDAPFGALPTLAEAVVSVRFADADQASHLDETVRAIAAKRAQDGLRLRVTGRMRRPPMVRSPADETFFADVERIAGRLNLRVGAGHRWHSSDICFAPAATPKIDGFGPVGGRERTAGEFAAASSLVDHAALLALVIRFCAGGSKL